MPYYYHRAISWLKHRHAAKEIFHSQASRARRGGQLAGSAPRGSPAKICSEEQEVEPPGGHLAGARLLPRVSPEAQTQEH